VLCRVVFIPVFEYFFFFFFLNSISSSRDLVTLGIDCQETLISIAIMPKKYYVTEADQKRPIVLGEKGLAAREPVTLPKMFLETVKKMGKNEAYANKDMTTKKWSAVTYEEYRDKAFAVAKSMLKLGLKRFEAVSVIGFNSEQWFLAAVGGILAGGISSGIYTTNGPDACLYQVEHSNSTFVFAENEAQMKKFVSVQDKLPKVKAFVQFSGKVPDGKKFYSWEKFLEVGAGLPDSDVEKTIEAQKPDECCCLIYTSGTTGKPKAVMISHDNLTWTATVICDQYKIEATDSLVSYLPLSHIAGFMLDITAPIMTGAKIYFAQPDALKGSLGETLKEARPTLFLGVPRVWEKIHEKMLSVGKQNNILMQTISSAAKYVGYYGSYAEQKHQPKPWGWWLASTFLFPKIRAALGLDRCRLCFTAAAPIRKETLEYFMSLYIPIYEIYGMSESTGPGTITLPHLWKTGSTGTTMAGTEILIKKENPNDQDGEICFRGRHVFMGYLKNEEATKETIDEEGWLHSGDIGRFDEEHFLHITGRKKELIITAGGENIPPVLIENEIKKEVDGLISNVMVVGDKRKFLTCLFAFRCKPKKDHGPHDYPFTDDLDNDALEILKKIGSDSKTVQEAMQDKKIKDFLQKALEESNKRAASNAQRIQKYAMVEKDFSLEGGELTSTLKLKRKVVEDNYKNVLDNLYNDSNE
jgi:long-chain-fatty-acid--CoA ligase ACSBG